jgi:hypothetical protein
MPFGQVNAMSLEELRGWAAFERLHPFESQRSDIQAALVARACAAPWGGPGDLKTYIPDYEKAALPPESPLEAAKRRERELVNAVHQRNQNPGHG